MRIAALYDIHGNLPALDAVLADVRRARVDRIVVGGDVLPGPMPREAIARLQSLDVPTRLPARQRRSRDARRIAGSAVAHPRIRPPAAALVPRAARRGAARGGRRMARRTFASTCRGLGSVLFCHATPRSDEEVVTHLIPEPLLRPIVERRGRRGRLRAHPRAVRRDGGPHALRERRQRRHAVREAGRLLAAARRRRRAAPHRLRSARPRPPTSAAPRSRTPSSSRRCTSCSRPTAADVHAVRTRSA